MNTLGRSLLSGGATDQARVAYQNAVALSPSNALAWCGVGAAQRHSGKLALSRFSYERALVVDSDLPQALTNLGEWYLVSGDSAAALDCFDRVLRRQPEFFEALSNRVAALVEGGRHREAEQAAKYGILLYPQEASLYVNLGNAYLQMDLRESTLAAYNLALALQPGYEDARFFRAVVFGDIDDLVAATEYIQKQIIVRGETDWLLTSLAFAQFYGKEYSAAERTSQKLLANQPNSHSGLLMLANCAAERGDPALAIDIFDQFVGDGPDLPRIRSNSLFLLNCLPYLDPAVVFRRHLDWAATQKTPRVVEDHPRVSSVDSRRRLKVGYVSGDFRSHPVGFLLLDVLASHDQRKFDIHCYSVDPRKPDIITEEIRSTAGAWRDMSMATDDKLIEAIRHDQIDILVDLSGHTAHHRLSVFAARPAPIQVTWLGYFHSTGMSSIDYFITDPNTSPVGSGQLFSEIPVHLPNTRFCFPSVEHLPDVAPAPITKNGFITFGSFNRLSKLATPVIESWATILDRVPNAKLVIKSGGLNEEDTCQRLRDRFSSCGLDPTRLILLPFSLHEEMYSEYGEIDLALDTLPFNGGMTSLEALSAGVPVVTLEGNSVVARQTVSALANIGLASELAFPDIASYIDGAVSLAHNWPRLVELRQELRPRMAASPLCDAAQFTNDLEALFRRMWEAECRGEKLANDIAPP